MDAQRVKNLIFAAGGAAAIGAVAYYLLKREPKEKALLAEASGKKEAAAQAVESTDKFSKEQVLQILQEITKSHEKMNGYMKELTQELLGKQMTFDQIYQRVKQVQPADPLEKYGLSMVSFDQLLDKHQGDQGVRESIAKIMGAPNINSCHSEKVQAITVKTIIDVHTYMLEELDTLVKDFLALPNKDSYNMQIVTIAAQVIVGSKVEAKFAVTSQDIESAVLMYHTMLATNQEFAAINIKIQQTMGKLMGTAFNTS